MVTLVFEIKTEEQWNKQVCYNLKNVRKAAGLTQAALAKRLGVPTDHISNLEQGKVKLSSWESHTLAKALGTPMESFYRMPPDHTKAKKDSLLTAVFKEANRLKEKELPVLISLLETYNKVKPV